MVAAVAGITDIGLGVDAKRVAALRQSGKVVYPEDLGIRRSDATRSLLAAGSVADLVEWSDGLQPTHRQNSGAGNEKSLPLHAESRVSWLAHTASACLIDEARLSPKPGLVDSRGNGAASGPESGADGALRPQPAADLFTRWPSKAGVARRTSRCAKPSAALAAKAKRR